MSLLDQPDQLREFLLAGKRGVVEEICKKFRFERTTYYRIIDLIVAKVMYANGLEESQTRDRKKNEDDRLYQEIFALVLAHPGWGCERIAQALASERRLSGPTVQKLLIQYGLGKQRERHLQLIDRALSGSIKKLSNEQLAAISKTDPSVIDTLKCTDPDYLDIELFLLPMPESFGEKRYLQLLVSYKSYFAFGRIIKKTRDFLTNNDIRDRIDADLALLVKETKYKRHSLYWATSLIFRDMSMYYPVHKDSRDTGEYFIEKPSPHRGFAPSVAKEIAKRLKHKLPERGTLLAAKEQQSTLEKVLHQYNTSKAMHGHPLIGKSPAAGIGLTASKTRAFLRQTVN